MFLGSFLSSNRLVKKWKRWIKSLKIYQRTRMYAQSFCLGAKLIAERDPIQIGI